MNNINFAGLARFNKATAAAVSQSVVQLIAAFVPFPPDLEQAIGIIMTALIVYLVPNQGGAAAAEPALPRNGEPLIAHLPLPAAMAGIAMTLLLAGCSGLVSGDELADRLLGPDCGPESRAFRSQSLLAGLSRAYPALETGRMRQSAEMMETAAAADQPLDLAGTAFQDALIAAMTPIVLEAGLAGEPLWLSLARLPPVAAELVFVRQQLAGFCAAA